MFPLGQGPRRDLKNRGGANFDGKNFLCRAENREPPTPVILGLVGCISMGAEELVPLINCPC